jgi:hypothetical protein
MQTVSNSEAVQRNVSTAKEAISIVNQQGWEKIFPTILLTRS